MYSNERSTKLDNELNDNAGVLVCTLLVKVVSLASLFPIPLEDFVESQTQSNNVNKSILGTKIQSLGFHNFNEINIFVGNFE